ncbi:DNA cytosine methyltransferase [Burkholderia contaminans]|uniref:DNA cytosine methyltransferase n=1 Tax=Burkholderia contaminans TaxID=488447 RepID=UPI001CD153B4
MALFAGAGGGILGGHLLGWRTVCAVERDAYAAQVLAQRQNDRALRPFPIWSDVRTFDGRPWQGIVDVVSGGFPCQDISTAGAGAGIDGERSGLWAEMARIIREVRPRFVLVENSPMLTSRGLGRVLGDLASMGLDARWGVISAADTGAHHLRERIWIVAHADGVSWNEWRTSDAEQGPQGRDADRGRIGAALADSDCERRSQARRFTGLSAIPDRRGTVRRFNPWPVEPGMGRVVDGVAHRVDRLTAIGNGQVPRVAATAFSILSASA